jgi:hypothetical protein
MRTRWAVLWVWTLVTSISTLRAVFVVFSLLFCCCKFQHSYHNNECCNIKNNTLHNVYKFILHSMKFINPYVSKYLLTWLIFDFWGFNATFSNISAISWRPVLVWEKPEYSERTTDHGQSTGKHYPLPLRVECTLFVINKAGREPTQYWW